MFPAAVPSAAELSNHTQSTDIVSGTLSDLLVISSRQEEKVCYVEILGYFA